MQNSQLATPMFDVTNYVTMLTALGSAVVTPGEGRLLDPLVVSDPRHEASLALKTLQIVMTAGV
jgi:hypothetical protein